MIRAVQSAAAASVAAIALMGTSAAAQAPAAPPAPPAPPVAPQAPDMAAAEAAMEAAAAAFEARMEGFGRRAEAIEADKGLSDAQRGARMAALWGEYQPEVAVFSAAIAEQAGAIAQVALAGLGDLDVGKLVADVLGDPEVQQAIRTGPALGLGMATNGAWAQNDPEQMVTYGLMAQYGMDLAMDSAEEALSDMEIDVPPTTR
ncbi:hypothetical protein ACO2Q1_15075 [Brevundimonas sp. VNH65]|uniref:hypothetical protein n=1 Tax=Brevundimonas sp. VNH65 TaxID=3400917 RepID=UPI003C10FD98